MAAAERLLEDPEGIRMVFQRLLQENRKLTLAYKEFKEDFGLLTVESTMLLAQVSSAETAAWKLGTGEKVALRLEDRGLKYEAVVNYEGKGEQEGLEGCRLAMPRSLRRADSHRVVDFIPEGAAKCTFTNARNALLDGQVKGFGMDGLELALRDPKQNIGEYMRLGEESTLDLPLEGGPHLMAKTRVAYLEANVVGLKFTEQADQALLGQYRAWVQGQQQLQIQRDRESLEGGRRETPRPTAATGPSVHTWSDKDPLILILTEREDFARHMGEALGRRFGVASLDYIKGPLRPQLKDLGSNEASWGRQKLILVHNQLRLASPLELTRQLTEQEKCAVPILAIGTEEDQDKKRNRFIAAGAVDFLPVEPFRILAVLRKLDETLKLFA